MVLVSRSRADGAGAGQGRLAELAGPTCPGAFARRAWDIVSDGQSGISCSHRRTMRAPHAQQRMS